MLTYLLIVLISLLLAFLCGSIPVAIIVGKTMRGLDVREHGSGNAGSANAIRVLGIGPGLLVFAGDVFKGALGCVIVTVATVVAIPVSSMLANQDAIELALSSAGTISVDPIVTIIANGYTNLLLEIPLALAILAAILGHMFSPFMSFKGGKGVATALGSIAVVLPFTALCSFAVFILVVLISRYISLGSIIAVITVPVFTAIFYPSPAYMVFTICVAAVVVWAHRKNIDRLRKKQEPKFSATKNGSK